MPIEPFEARYLLNLIKARSLVMIDDKNAHSPFPWDKNFFDKLRPDQVPRFLRCITDPWKLPLRIFSLSDLAALQNRVEVDKVESIRSNRSAVKPAVAVRIREGRPWTIADGLHRSTADWLDHKDHVEFYFCDLSDKKHTVEPVPGAGKFEGRQDEVQERSVDRSERM